MQTKPFVYPNVSHYTYGMGRVRVLNIVPSFTIYVAGLRQEGVR